MEFLDPLEAETPCRYIIDAIKMQLRCNVDATKMQLTGCPAKLLTLLFFEFLGFQGV